MDFSFSSGLKSFIFLSIFGVNSVFQISASLPEPPKMTSECKVWGALCEPAAWAKEHCTHTDLSSQSCCLRVVSLVQALDWWPMKYNSSHQPLGL